VHDQDAPEDRQFTVLRTRLFARNNLLQEDKGNEPVFRTEFDATRKYVPIIPAFSTTEHAKPVAPTLLTAFVVGPPGEEIHVNEYGCNKVRMPFTRSRDHVFAEGAGASGTDRDSLWIRVAQPWTGTHYGQVWIPRIGDEVLVQFINGDIDRPIGSAVSTTARINPRRSPMPAISPATRRCPASRARWSRAGASTKSSGMTAPMSSASAPRPTTARPR
jgi:type VI secretion system secreted protein VgrG